MSMHRVGVSLACLMISTGAIAETPESKSSHHPSHFQSAKVAKSVERAHKARTALCGADHSRSEQNSYADAPSSGGGGGLADAYIGPVRPVGQMQVGTAAWYDWVGSRTASGEILDSVTATAAHRSLPLLSYARVTNLDTGRSVIVKINDRGPGRRRFIIDLSPRAAKAIDVIRTGIAAVIVEPVSVGAGPAGGAAPKVAVFQSSGAAAIQ